MEHREREALVVSSAPGQDPLDLLPMIYRSSITQYSSESSCTFCKLVYLPVGRLRILEGNLFLFYK